MSMIPASRLDPLAAGLLPRIYMAPVDAWERGTDFRKAIGRALRLLRVRNICQARAVYRELILAQALATD